jgi:diadenylate cyclase
MSSLQPLYAQIVFFFSNLTWLGVIDLLLVTAAFYLILSLLRRSSAAYLLREVILVVVGLFLLTTILPLPVFDWVLRAFLIGILVATPIVFQAQIRQYLSRVSRTSGIARAARRDVAEAVIPEIVHAAENMASTRTGALIVLEGNDPLDEIAQGGITSDGRVTSELLQSIFYVGTPLHDGGVIIRADRVLSAGCVLPLSQQILEAEIRLGTRHRAAVGMSEVSDALVVVISEETGQIGVAQNGQLDRPLNSAGLRDRLQDFVIPSEESRAATPSLWSMGKQLVRHAWRTATPNSVGEFFSDIGLLLMSLALTLVVWTFVLQQTNALELARVEGIPVRVEGLPAGTKLTPDPPSVVSAVIQTPSDVLPTLSNQSFQATITIEQQEPGLYRLPVEVESSVDQVLVMSVEPEAVDLQVVPIISRTVPVLVQIPDPQSLSAAYELVGTPAATPATAQVEGPAPLVENVQHAQASVSVANVNTSVRGDRPLAAVDDQGQVVTGVSVNPTQAKVNVNIRQRVDARDVSVQANLTGTPPADYQLRSVSVAPASVTLQGSANELANIGSVVNTVPLDISQITGDTTLQAALDLPPNVQALDSNGQPVPAVAVTVRVSPLTGNLTISRPVEVINATPALTITVIPERVDLLLSGPLPVLDNIGANPDTIRVLADAAGLRRAQTTNITPQVLAPEDINSQIVPPSVQIRAE